MKVKNIILLISSISCAYSVYAQDNIPNDLGGPRFLAWQNDYHYLAHTEHQTDYWAQGLNYIALGSNPDRYLTLGGEARWVYEYLNHASANLEANDKSESLAQRLRLFGDLHFNQNFRLFFELGDNWAFGAEVPTPANYDAFDIQQLFFDASFQLNPDIQLTVRPGRFVMPLGSKILVSTRDGSNVQYNYQGLRAWFDYQHDLKLDMFSVQPIQFKRGAFDDRADDHREFKGIYLSKNLLDHAENQSNLDLYFFDLHHDQRLFTDHLAEQNRQSIGLRLYGQKNQFHYDLEYVQQFGHYGDQDIQAYALLSTWAYHFQQALDPALSLQAMIFSGDNHRNAHKMKTFEAPFPKTALFSGAAEFGLMNSIFIKPSLSLQLLPKLSLSGSYALLQKQQNNDAIYRAPSGIAWNDDYPTRAKHIANIAELELNYDYNRNLNFNVLFSNVDAKQALKEIGGKTNNYISVTTQFKF